MKTRIYKSGKYWYAKVPTDDGVKSISLHTTTREEAEKVIKKLGLGDVTTVSDRRREEKKRKPVTLSELLLLMTDNDKSPLYAEKEKTGHLIRESSKKVYHHSANSIIKLCPKLTAMPFEKMGTKDIRRIRDTLIDTGLIPSMVNMRMKVVKMVFHGALNQGWIERDPSKSIMMMKEAKETVSIPTIKDIERIASAFHWQSEVRRDVFLFLAMTGLRKSECIGLTKEQLTYEEINGKRTMIMRVDRQLVNGKIAPTKTGAIRTVPLSKRAEAIIRRNMREDKEYIFRMPPYLFTFGAGGRNSQELKALIEDKKAREDFSTHKLRHLFNSLAIAHDERLAKAVGEYCGWNHQIQGFDDDVILRGIQRTYTHKRVEYLMKVANAIDEIFSFLDEENP